MGKKARTASDAQKWSESVAKSFVSKKAMKADPSGSYTGHPKDAGKPEQDADDL